MNETDELNEWIAEHVMGWHVYKTGRGSIAAMEGMNTLDETSRIVTPHHPWDDPSEFNPTKSPADAMAVLEKCIDRCSPLDLSIGIWRKGDKFRVFAGKYNAEADSLTLVICLFTKQLYKEVDRT